MSSKSVNKTPSKYELSVAKAVKAIRKMMPGIGQSAVTVFQAYIGKEMGLSGAGFPSVRKEFSQTPGSLSVQSGRLYRSFGLKPDSSGDSMTDVSVSGDKIKVVLGSRLPYAKIHDKGGFVKSKGKMEWYLLHKAEETGIIMYRIIALSLLKKKAEGRPVGIDIAPTHYFTNATADFSREGMPFIAKNFNKEIKAELKKIGL